MKCLKNKIIRNLYFFILGLSIVLYTSCDESIEVFTSDELEINTEYPDLRFSNIEDRYNYAATPTLVDSIQVESLYHDWEIIGSGEDSWYNINPSSGSAGELYKIGMSPSVNTDLDDRIDTLKLISKDWEGRRFIVFQKGTAFLETVVVDSVLAETIGDQISLNIESNQDWSVSIAEDIDWMAIEGSDSGNGDGSVTLKSIKENGSIRKNGLIYLFDRHDILVDSVAIYQSGLFLRFGTNLDAFAMAGSTANVQVNSNTSWNLTIPEEAESWITVDKTTGNNDETVSFTIDENLEESRSAYVILESVPALIKDSVLVAQNGLIPFTEEFFYPHENATNDVTFNIDGSATLKAPPGTGSRNLMSKIDNFSYGKYTINFSDYQLAESSSTMLMCITKAGNLNGGISLGTYASPSLSDGWAAQYRLVDGFGDKTMQVDNDIPRDAIEKFTIDVKKSDTAGLVDVDLYINDQLISSEEVLDGFADGSPYILSFWIYNYYDSANPAVFEPISLIYVPYMY